MKSILRTSLCILTLSLCLASQAPADILRLGDDVRPVFQSIALRLDAQADTYEGSTRIELDVKRPVASFRLHAERLEIHSLTLTRDGRPVDCSFHSEDSATLLIELSSELETGPLVLEAVFTNDFDRRAQGLFKAEVDGVGYTFTQFEEDDAREAFPCFDEPSFKFPYQLVLTVPKGHLALANTPIESEELEEGWRTVTFRRSPPLPSYLLALATGPLDTVPLPGMGVPARVVTTRGKGHLATLAVEVAPPLLKSMEEYFGRSYPFEKLDLIAVPEFWPGAMENPGAITFSDGVLLADPAQTGVGGRRRMASVMAHEFAHMWFGDLVTMAWWNDLWLNESFAEWLGDKITNQVYPELGLDIATAQSVGRTMNSDARPSSRAIRQPVATTADLTGNLGPIYSKGQAVLGMFESWLGPDEFRRGIRTYLRQKEWSNATADDLWQALEQESGWNVGEALSTFIDQPGIPLVKVSTENSGRIHIRQTRMANFGVEVAPLEPWHIPLAVRYADHGGVHEQLIVLTEPEMTVDLGTDGPPQWILPHAEARAYCRWSVPYEMMLTLARGAESTLSARERVGFLGNLGALLDAGLLSGDEYLELVAGFRHDPHPQVISAVVGALANVESAFVTDSLKPLFAPYVQHTLGPALERIGLQRRPDEDETVTQLRPRLLGWLADEGADSSLNEFARTVFNAYLTGNESVDPELISVSVNLACRHGDRAQFETCRSRFEQSQTPAERDRFLSALGAFEDPAIQEEALRYALEGPLRPQEVFDIPMGIAAHSEAHTEQIFQWVLDHWDVVSEKLPPMYRSYLPMMASGCSTQRLERARSFFSEPGHASPGVDSRLARVADAVHDCVSLREREGGKVSAYLALFSPGSGGAGQAAGAKQGRR